MPHPRLPFEVAAAALVAVAACTPLPPSSSAALLTAQGQPPHGAICTISAAPAQLPDPAELIDAEAFRAAAGRLWVAAGKPAGYVLFTVRHGLDGAQVRRAVIESTAPDPLTDSLQALVFAYRRVTPPATAEWGVRLRAELGNEIDLRVGRRLECAPRPREEERIAADPFDIRERGLTSAAALTATDPGRVWVHVLLDSRGRVTDASVERGMRRGMGEQRVLNHVRAMAFYPALDDGYPVPGETTISLRLSTIR
jgi:hypothetical protein